VEVNDIRGKPKTVPVGFTCRGLGGPRGHGDKPNRAGSKALVVARGVEGVGYTPPEHDLPGLGQADYGYRPLEEVRARGLAHRWHVALTVTGRDFVRLPPRVARARFGLM